MSRTSPYCCVKCGMPGAVLHFPGGHLCEGGCKNPFEGMAVVEPASDKLPESRIQQLESELAAHKQALALAKEALLKWKIEAAGEIFTDTWFTADQALAAINAIEKGGK